MNRMYKALCYAVALTTLLLTACDGGSGSTTSSYTIGGTVTGLNGTLILQNNGGDDLTVSTSGDFTFTGKVSDNGTYAVTVLTQPTGQTCSVSTGAGTVSGGNVSNIAVTCSTNAYTVGGAVSGLSGAVVLQNNSGDDLSLSADGTFTFATSVAYGSTYSVTVLTQPTGQTCSVSTGAGTVSGGNVSNIAVTCSTNAYPVGGTVSGLIGSVVLQNNSGNDLTVSADGTFYFDTPVAYGSPYSVTVLTQPATQSCSVANGTGTIAAAYVSDVTITCTTNTYTVGGTVSGLNGSVVLQNNAADNHTVSVNGPFSFPTTVGSGNPYLVSVLTNPTAQHCGVSSGSGTIATSNISNVGVVCANNQLGGAIQLGTPLNLTATVTTFAGVADTTGSTDGVGTAASFNQPVGITSDGSSLYVVDRFNLTIRKIDIATGAVTTLAGTAGTQGSADGTGAAASFNYPMDITTDGSSLYVAGTNYHTIRKIDIATAAVTTLAGQAGAMGTADGTGVVARFNNPMGITTDGISLYVSDGNSHTIRKIDIATAVVTTLAGQAGTTGTADGVGTAASFNTPRGITTDGSSLYVVDYMNSTIRKIDIATGTVTTFAGQAGTPGTTDDTGTAARFSYPAGITTDGFSLYVSDSSNHNIRKIDIATAAVTTLAGSGTWGAVDGVGTAAKFNAPRGITSDGTSLFVSDRNGHTIRKID